MPVSVKYGTFLCLNVSPEGRQSIFQQNITRWINTKVPRGAKVCWCLIRRVEQETETVAIVKKQLKSKRVWSRGRIPETNRWVPIGVHSGGNLEIMFRWGSVRSNFRLCRWKWHIQKRLELWNVCFVEWLRCSSYRSPSKTYQKSNLIRFRR